MNENTITGLNHLNKDFYNSVSKVWNNSPDYEWEGWNATLEYFKKICSGCNNKRLSVLDIGCGNGRFSSFLEKNQTVIGCESNYVGLDFSTSYINQNCGGKNSKIVECDVASTEFPLTALKHNEGEKFNVIVMFGLVHHIPGFQTRLRLFENMFNLLTSDGILIFTTWQFLDSQRLRKRITSIDTPEIEGLFARYGISKNELEYNDFILDWVKRVTAYRYAHAFDDDEMNTLVNASGCKIIKTYLHDGRYSKRNRYFVCIKNS